MVPILLTYVRYDSQRERIKFSARFYKSALASLIDARKAKLGLWGAGSPLRAVAVKLNVLAIFSRLQFQSYR